MPPRLLDFLASRARLVAVVAAAVLAGAAVGMWAAAGTPSSVLTALAATYGPGTADATEDPGNADDRADKTTDKATGKATETPGSKSDKTDKPASESAGDAAAKPGKRAKPAKAGPPGQARGVHGACVSAVARSTPAPTASPGAHGAAVSRAAHTCPHNKDVRAAR